MRTIGILACVLVTSAVLGSQVPAPSQDSSWIREMRRLLPKYQVRVVRVEPEIPGFDGQASPTGKWLVDQYTNPLPADAEGGTEEMSLRLHSPSGKFIRDLTLGRLSIVLGVAWSQTDNGLFVSGAPVSSDGTTPDEVWKVDLRSGALLRLSLPWMPKSHVPVWSLKYSEDQYALPIWSPRGDSYLVVDEAEGAIYRVSLKPALVVKALAEGHSPVWSPNGLWIAFTKYIEINGTSRARWWVMRDDGSGQRPLLPDDTLAVHGERLQDMQRLVWLPDSSHLLVVGHFGDKKNSLLLLNGSGRSVRMLGPGASVASGSTNGRHLYLHDSRGGLYYIRLVPRKRGGTRK